MIEQFINQVSGNVKELINNYVLNPFVQFMNNIPWWAELLILLAAILVVVFGVIGLIKAMWKFLLIVAILGGIGFAVYYFFFKDKAATTETVSLLTLSFNLIKVLI